MAVYPTERERERGISADYMNAFIWLHAYLDARVNRVPGIDVAALGTEYLAERSWARLADGDTPERRELERAIAWINAQLTAGVFYEDDAVALRLYTFCRALVLFVREEGPAPEIPVNGDLLDGAA